MYAVNGREIQAKSGRAKEFYEDNEFIRMLFSERGKIVHRNYLITENELTAFYGNCSDKMQELEQFLESDLEKEGSMLETLNSF